MAQLTDFYPAPSAGVDYDVWDAGVSEIDYSDTTGFTVVSTVGELTTAIEGVITLSILMMVYMMYQT